MLMSPYTQEEKSSNKPDGTPWNTRATGLQGLNPMRLLTRDSQKRHQPIWAHVLCHGHRMEHHGTPVRRDSKDSIQRRQPIWDHVLWHGRRMERLWNTRPTGLSGLNPKALRLPPRVGPF